MIMKAVQLSTVRYRYEFKSENLWREIKFVLDNFAMPLTQLFNVIYFVLRQIFAQTFSKLT